MPSAATGTQPSGGDRRPHPPAPRPRRERCGRARQWRWLRHRARFCPATSTALHIGCIPPDTGHQASAGRADGRGVVLGTLRNQGGYTVAVNNHAPVTNSAARTRWEGVERLSMRRRRIAFKPAAILADEIALGHRTRPGDAHHEHRRGGGVGHTGCLPVPSGTIVWLSAVRSRPSWPLSRPGCARNIRIVPVNAVGSARSATSACAWIAIEATRGPSSGCCSQPTAAAGRRTTGRDRDRSGDAHTVPGSVAVPQPP